MNTDTEGFGALVTEIQKRVTIFSPAMSERLGELWDEYPTLAAHLHALKETDARASGFNLKYYESCLSSYAAKRAAQAPNKGIAELHAARVSEGTDPNETTKDLEETGLRVQLNRLLGLPDRNPSPAFRIGIEQVELACALLFRAKRETDPTLARWTRYEAERVIYPHQSEAAYQSGHKLLNYVFKVNVDAEATT